MEEPSLPREFTDPRKPLFLHLKHKDAHNGTGRLLVIASGPVGVGAGSWSASSCHTNPHACEHRLCVCIGRLCFQMLLGMFFLNNPAATPLCM